MLRPASSLFKLVISAPIRICVQYLQTRAKGCFRSFSKASWKLCKSLLFTLLLYKLKPVLTNKLYILVRTLICSRFCWRIFSNWHLQECQMLPCLLHFVVSSDGYYRYITSGNSSDVGVRGINHRSQLWTSTQCTWRCDFPKGPLLSSHFITISSVSG